MPGSIRRLSELLSEVWDRTHHIFPASASRRLVQWLALSDSLVVQDDPSNIGVESVPYPAIWASGTADIYWGRGVWSPISYSYCRTIAIDHTKVPGGLADYPFLFNETIAELATVANGGHVENTASGGVSGSYTVPADLIFSPNTDGSEPYDFEVERYDATTGELVAWVRIPTLASDVDTVLYILYGRSSVTTSQESVAGVWDGDFKGVWHLAEETAGTGGADVYKDSSGNAHHGDDYVSATGQTGKIGAGQEFDGADDYILVPDSADHDAAEFTIEQWVRFHNLAGGDQTAFSKYVSKDGFQAGIQSSGNYVGITVRDTAEATHKAQELIAGNYSNDTWYYLVWTRVGGATDELKFYRGASLKDTNTDSFTFDPANGADLHIGDRTDSAQEFDGEQDEIRYSNVVRSTDYITATFNNQDDPGTFYTVGAE